MYKMDDSFSSIWKLSSLKKYIKIIHVENWFIIGVFVTLWLSNFTVSEEYNFIFDEEYDWSLCRQYILNLYQIRFNLFKKKYFNAFQIYLIVIWIKFQSFSNFAVIWVKFQIVSNIFAIIWVKFQSVSKLKVFQMYFNSFQVY